MQAALPPLDFEFFCGHEAPAVDQASTACFDPWFEAPFYVEGLSYPAVAHFMMAEKARLFGDEAAWARARYGAVVQGNLAKFGQHPDLANALMRTDGKILAHASATDLIWGIGLPADHPDATQPASWPGRNLLGFALMDVRSQLLAGASDATGAGTAMASSILMSACLCGAPVRYDGKDVPCNSSQLEPWRADGRVMALCPEMLGGLPAPRAPAEITPGATGEDVLTGCAQVLDRHGRDWTAPFWIGALRAADLARRHGVRVAILKSRSPSCGHDRIYDGRFAGVLTAGDGVTAAALRRQGVSVFDENTLDQAIAHLGEAPLHDGTAL